MSTPHAVVIVEDEPLARARLRDLLGDVEWLEVVGEASTGPEGLALIERLRPAVAFLDVRMPGLSGLEIAGRLRHRPLLVFTTAHTDHAVEAFGVRAIDYLVKPFGRRRLADTLHRLRAALGREGEAAGPLRQLLIRSGTRVLPVEIDAVIRFEGRDDYVAVHTASRVHLASVRMAELERSLDGERFVRIHRSHIVALAHVREIRTDGDGRLNLVMSDGTTLRASRSRGRELRSRFR